MITLEEEVILVDAMDREVGTMPKQKAHLEGRMHRAFSIFIFNTAGKVLLQQRALDKYHSPGKWTNTCCSHPRPNELTIAAAHRRLMEEMGMTCLLRPVFEFSYHAEFDNGLIEHEFDHVFFGESDVKPMPNPAEVANFDYVDMEELRKELIANPDRYTPWLKICFEQARLNYLKERAHG